MRRLREIHHPQREREKILQDIVKFFCAWHSLKKLEKVNLGTFLPESYLHDKRGYVTTEHRK